MSFCLGTPNGSPEILNIGTFATLETHNIVCTPLIKMILNQSCSPCGELSNGMWHAT
jgi:hypothetical protein